MSKDDFEIIECTADSIKTNREPQDENELEMMRNASMDKIIRNLIANPPSNIIFND